MGRRNERLRDGRYRDRFDSSSRCCPASRYHHRRPGSWAWGGLRWVRAAHRSWSRWLPATRRLRSSRPCASLRPRPAEGTRAAADPPRAQAASSATPIPEWQKLSDGSALRPTNPSLPLMIRSRLVLQFWPHLLLLSALSACVIGRPARPSVTESAQGPSAA